jgi:hypothetical protein
MYTHPSLVGAALRQCRSHGEGVVRGLAIWASKPRWSSAGFTRLVVELADLPGHPARAIARRHKTAMESRLTEELARRRVADAALRARQIVLLLEGCQVSMLIHGDRRHAEAAAQAAVRLVAR